MTPNPSGKNRVEWAEGEIEEYRRRHEAGTPLKGRSGLAREKGCTHVTMRAALTGVPAKARRGTGPEQLTDAQRNEASRAIERGEDRAKVAERYGRTLWWAHWLTHSYTRTDDGGCAGLVFSREFVKRNGGHNLPDYIKVLQKRSVREQIRRL